MVALFVCIQTRTASNVATAAYQDALGRAFFLAWQFAGHWRPGWHYIMDPSDATATSWSLGVLGLVQVGAFVRVAPWSPAGDQAPPQADDTGGNE